ncbi:MAG: 1-deoxy-D-xylulose-5-phosphate synthase [Nitrospirae bacterium]|nr:1-deoxy-D-xylulose-5-phosphate synthase [Nitrospirota bacterium]
MDLSEISSPEDLKLLSTNCLITVADQLRKIIINIVSNNGGHLASSLGVIELTLALHYVYNCPYDKIVWDVGHQAYAHKILTGRYNQFHTLRQYGGISGFPKRSESPYDSFGVGHSSTSISAALGIIEGRDRVGKDFKVVAVIGDGALTGGIAFEGLNNTGHLKKDLTVVLNDNKMSISKNVGALSSYLTRLMTGNLYQKLKKETKSLIETIPRFGEQVSKLAQKTEDTFKYFFVPGILFEELGFNYVGPIDGHDIEKLIETFELTKDYQGPTLIHIITKKGKGYEFSEAHPSAFHGIGPFEPDTGIVISGKKVPDFSSAFGEALCNIAAEDPRVLAITAAMTEGTGLGTFAKRFPERFYDVGIAEPHAVTFAAGLATNGLRPVFAVYSTFLQRAYDQVIHDVCLQNLPVIFAIDRAGLVGEDGPTHHGAFDVSFLRHIPNLTFMAPKNSVELGEMLKLAISLNSPCAIRFPRGVVVQELEEINISPVTYGKVEVINSGSEDSLAILAVGHSVQPSLGAVKRLQAEGISVTLVNMRFIKPLDTEFIQDLINKTKNIVTVEENSLAGGFGSLILEYLNSINADGVKVKMIGLPDTFIEHGAQKILRKLYGLDEVGIFETALTLIKGKG